MYALISRENPANTRDCCPNASWEDYCTLCDSQRFIDSPHQVPRWRSSADVSSQTWTWCQHPGWCGESLTWSPESELRSVTPITMALPELGGIEPDYCFYIDNWQAIVGRDRLQWGIDLPPDLVIEIDVTTYTDANDYLLYGVPEVWLLKRTNLPSMSCGKASTARRQSLLSRYRFGSDCTSCLQAAKWAARCSIRELRQRLSSDVWRFVTHSHHRPSSEVPAFKGTPAALG